MAKINLDINLNNGETLQLGNKDILSVESLSQSNGQPKGIFYGVTPNSGRAEINDNNGDFAKMIRNGTIKNSNMPISVFANGKKVQEHLTTDSDYDNNGRVFSMQFENELSKWDSFQYGGLELNTDNVGNPIPDNAYNMLVSVLTNEYVGYTPSEVDDMLTTQIVYGANNTIGSVKEYLQSITINAPYLASCSLRETIEKFCLLAQLNVYEDNNGKIKFVSARPKRVGHEPILVIPPKKQFSALTKDIILKNKFDGVEFSAKQVNNIIEYDTVVFTNKYTQFSLQDGLSNNDTKGVVITGGSQTIPTSDTTNIFTGIDNVKYITLNIEFDKKQDNETILRVINGLNNNNEPNINISITYDVAYGNISSATFSEDSSHNWHTSNIVYSNPIGNKPQKTIQVNQNNVSFTRTRNVKGSALPRTLTSTTTHINAGNIQNAIVNENNGVFTLSLTILASRRYTTFWQTQYSSLTTETLFYGNYSDVDDWNGWEHHTAKQVEITLNGNKRIISFEDFSLSSDPSAETVVSLQGNELTQTPNVTNGIENTIVNNIKSDYANGISTATVTVSCSDYKDTNGNVIKRWENGEIINVGDIVRLDKDNNGNSAFCYENGSQMLWKVTGRTFRNEGIPFCDLELQEIL